MPDPAAPATPATPPAAAAPPATPATTAAPATPAAAAPATAAPAPAATPSLLSAGALDIPEKFKVTKTDGSVDHEATLRKALGSVEHLEKRLGTGDVPPENEAGYKLDYSAFPDGVKISPEGEKAFLKSMHSAGLTNKQVQTVVNKYAEVIKAGQDIQKQQMEDQAKAALTAVAGELKTAWGEQNDANVKAAQRGFNHLADEADRRGIALIGTDLKTTYRTLMKVLAKVGQGITEDTPPTGATPAIDNDIETLRKSKAYTDANDPEHKATVAKVEALYKQKYPKKG